VPTQKTEIGKYHRVTNTGIDRRSTFRDIKQAPQTLFTKATILHPLDRYFC